MNWHDYFFYLQKIGTRYFLLAGLGFLIFYIIFRRQKRIKKIQELFPETRDYVREIFYSVLTIGIFSAVPLVILQVPAIKAHTFFYRDISQHGWSWFFLAFPIMLLVHDAYFYWMHRLMHRPRLFRIFHLVHHRSTNPSPWAAYAFHPFEALLEAGIFAVFLFTMPVTPLHLGSFFLFMIIYNVYGHLGYELYPKGFSRHWLGKWINTGVNHNQHHQYFKGNYGLYFLWWDRWLGTIRDDYDEKFDLAKLR